MVIYFLFIFADDLSYYLHYCCYYVPGVGEHPAVPVGNVTTEGTDHCQYVGGSRKSDPHHGPGKGV